MEALKEKALETQENRNGKRQGGSAPATWHLALAGTAAPKDTDLRRGRGTGVPLWITTVGSSPRPGHWQKEEVRQGGGDHACPRPPLVSCL